MARFWISDLHWDVHSVIKWNSRPYVSVQQMNAAFTANWNYYVTKEDTVVFVGDWCNDKLGYLHLANLNFKHMYFIIGNHDQPSWLGNMLATDPRLMHLIDKITILDHLVVEIGDKDYYVVHRPIRARDDMPTICGHVHVRWKYLDPGVEIGEHSRHEDKATKVLTQPILNVGCDVHNWRPISDHEVMEFFNDHWNKKA